jgi:hypothetical protein
MIHVKEKSMGKDSIALEVSGVLDEQAVPVLEDLCRERLGQGKGILVDLKAVVHITREGREFIRGIQRKVTLSHLPEFMRHESSAPGKP